MSVKPIPEGYHTLTPFLTVRDAARAIEFYKQAFGATERGVAKGPDGKVMHAEIKIGDSIIMMSDEFPEFGSLSPESVGNTSMPSAGAIQTPDVRLGLKKNARATRDPART